jgi:4a-hydroxytetrahydrobiopterin dehydratase
MGNLAEEYCRQTQPGEGPLADAEAATLGIQIQGWETVVENGVHRLRKAFVFRNFAESLAFTNCVGQLAEAQDHHPSLVTEWGRVTVTWWTHSVSGLHRNDFIMAARTDRI